MKEEALRPGRPARRSKSAVVPTLFTFLVGGVFFGLYRYVSRTPAPAEAQDATAAKAGPAKAPVDPFLKELLGESNSVTSPPATTRPAPESRGEQAAPKPATAPPARAAAAFDPDFRSRGGNLEAELTALKRITRHGSDRQVKAGEPVHYSGFSQLPVTITANIGFKAVRTWLESVQQSCPAASVGELKLKRRQGRDAQPPHGLTMEATVWLHAKAPASEGAAGGGDERNIVPRLDFARVLRELSALAGDDPVQFVDITIAAEKGRPLGPTQAPRIVGTFSWFGHQDVVDLLAERIPNHPFIDRHTVEAKGPRRTVQFSTPPADRMPPPAEALRDADSLDPFRIVNLKTGR
jgi:hypothetical protein